MAVKTIAQLRLRFAVDGASPTQQDYVDLVDTLMDIENQVDDILVALQPVAVVADEAARLALGPTLALYRKVKQTDNGITYVLQTGDGSVVGDWEDIGDVQLVIPDVISLQDELDRRLNKINDDETTGQLGLKHFYLTSHSVDATPLADTIDVQFATNKVMLVYRDVDFTILPAPIDPDTVNAQTIILVKNVSAGPINVNINRPVGIDFVFVLDQSGSMADIRVMMPDLVRGLEARLNAIGVGTDPGVPNRYAMIEQGSGFAPTAEIPFSDYATFLAAAYAFTYPGGSGTDGPLHQEDAYEGIDYAIKNLVWRNSDSVNKLIFCMTDEDRNPTTAGGSTYVWYPEGDSITYPDQASHIAYLKAELIAGDFVLAGMFATTYTGLSDGLDQPIIATDYTGRCYKEDGAGGYLEVAAGGGHEDPGTSSGDNSGLEGFGAYEEYYSLLMDPTIKGYFVDIWAYRAGNTTGYNAVDGGNTAEQSGDTVTITDVGGRTFTAADLGRFITITGGASALILTISSPTVATVHNSQAIGPSDFTISARLWQGYYHRMQQVGTTVTITTPVTTGFVFATTAIDVGKVIRFATGEEATIVSVTSLTEAEVNISQSVASTSFITFPNEASAAKSRSVLSVIVPMLSERIRQELSQFIVTNPDFVFPMIMQPDEWKRFTVTGATVPMTGTIPGRKLLLG